MTGVFNTYDNRPGRWEPFHPHDCDGCIYLGSEIRGTAEEARATDYYYCPGKIEPTIIARTGIDGDYASGMPFGTLDRPMPALKRCLELAMRHPQCWKSVDEYHNRGPGWIHAECKRNYDVMRAKVIAECPDLTHEEE